MVGFLGLWRILLPENGSAKLTEGPVFGKGFFTCGQAVGGCADLFLLDKTSTTCLIMRFA
jgi:hypothetical protein